MRPRSMPLLPNWQVSRSGGRRSRESCLPTRSVVTDGSGESGAVVMSYTLDFEVNRVSEPHRDQGVGEHEGRIRVSGARDDRGTPRGHRPLTPEAIPTCLEPALLIRAFPDDLRPDVRQGFSV